MPLDAASRRLAPEGTACALNLAGTELACMRIKWSGMPLIGLIFRRLLSAVPNLVGVVILTFVLTRMLPGDPAAYFAGPAATPASIEEVRKQLGLDRSVFGQFFSYLGQLAHGDLDRSLTSGQHVVADLVARLA